ncbi:DHBP synthase RibB-like alpha/beta domain-containing protein [Kalaharituber pfeilii]|nr:DHBP synthase RibB-like alpha/beta domain-containing protein [Kalaharituber pfeilii]
MGRTTPVTHWRASIAALTRLLSPPGSGTSHRSPQRHNRQQHLPAAASSSRSASTMPHASAPSASVPSFPATNGSGTLTDILKVDPTSISFTPAPASHHHWQYDSPILEIRCAETRRNLERAAAILREGSPVAFPTETVYGLGADATNDEGVKRIFKAKNRPVDNPLIVHVASLRQLRELLNRSRGTEENGDRRRGVSDQNGLSLPIEIPEVYAPLISGFWPGPLTILLNLPATTPLSKHVTAEQTTFAVRIPNHPIALALAHMTDLPIAAPSANASGKPSPTSAAHVYTDLKGRIPLILDGGEADVGVESTVVSGLCNPPRILRPGGKCIAGTGKVTTAATDTITMTPECGRGNSTTEVIPLVPGMKYRHYSPKATVILYEPGTTPPGSTELGKSVGWRGKVGIIRTRTWSGDIAGQVALELAIRRNGQGVQNGRGGVEGGIGVEEIFLGTSGAEISRGLFAALRELDARGVGTIHVEGIEEEEEGLAVMNRLRKAANVVVQRRG